MNLKWLIVVFLIFCFSGAKAKTVEKIYEGKPTFAASLMGLGCQLRLETTREGYVIGYKVSNSSTLFWAATQERMIPSQNTSDEIDDKSFDGTESLTVRFYNNEPIEYEYHLYTGHPQYVYCKALKPD